MTPNSPAPSTSAGGAELPGARLLLEPTLTREGMFDGAWWPRSRDPQRELPALLAALDPRFGPVLRVRLDPDAWDVVPHHLVMKGRFLRISYLPGTAGTIRVIRGDQDGLLLLVIPPDTAESVAEAAMAAAACPGSSMFAADILARGATARPASGAEPAPPPVRGSAVRPYGSADLAATLALVNADRLPGQPACSPRMLGDAVTGTSAGNPLPWAELDPPHTDVLVDKAGAVLGAVSYAVRPRDDAGLILWLHAREVPAVVEILVEHALRRLRRRSAVHAFAFASALNPTLAALPAARRPVTSLVLEQAGFSSSDSWRYLRRVSAGIRPVAVSSQIQVAPSSVPSGWWLTIPGHDLAAEAVAATPSDGVGTLWWFGPDAAHADQELDRALLDRALALLYAHGAHEAVLYADGEGASLFDTAGFALVDRLYTYTRNDTAASRVC
ncbi:DUF5994 family protein [Thermoactinospora rubra]|uniref:DUF5994 family protein n=1 Tax=Thermoactinospora rubra TaxID=1088767 RepID=UPI000A104C98|nr:DUF5994 family protein [Thermoactinospora rubra]